MKVRYIGENDPRALLTGKIYPVIATEYGWYLIRNESGKAFMYPPSSFEVVIGLVRDEDKRDQN